MTDPKEFYKYYEADDNLSPLSYRVLEEIKAAPVNHVLEFGSGSGKHLAELNKAGIPCHGIDISASSVVRAMYKHNVPSVARGDESYLRHYCNFDIIFTVSVLDHFENIEGVLGEFFRIANKKIILAETQDTPASYYYKHDYEEYGFIKLDFSWKSNGDGATYHLWIWERPEIIEDDNFNRE